MRMRRNRPFWNEQRQVGQQASMITEHLNKSRVFTAGEIVEATGGHIVAGSRDYAFRGISIDSRNIASGELFWTIKGERFDGNDFIKEAIGKGAAGIVTEKADIAYETGERLACIWVNSSLKALQALAAFNRRRFRAPVIAVTGSNGKTTTKEILASVLMRRYRVLKNYGNMNNLIGVPLTLLAMHSGHEAAVIEIGMNKRGEIRKLARICAPDIGVITNIGEAHLEGLGSLENIKRAKGELVEAMASENRVVLNVDDSAVMDLAASAECDVVTFGLNNHADIMAREVEIEWGKGTLFILSGGGKSIPVLFPLYGVHQLYNALAAAAAAYSLGLDLYEIREGLEAYEPYSGRMEILAQGGVHIINDSYNANPPSVKYAVDTMKKLGDGRTIAVLGDMLEMGDDAEELHAHIGEYVFTKGIDLIVTVGALAGKIGEGAIAGGMDANKVFSFEEKNEAIRYIKKTIACGDWLLVKGSRGMKMEEITYSLVRDLAPENGENG